MTLTCQLENGTLLAGNTIWKHNDRVMNETSPNLKITYAQELDSGEYMCKGENSQLSDPVHLSIFSGEFGPRGGSGGAGDNDALPSRKQRTLGPPCFQCSPICLQGFWPLSSLPACGSQQVKGQGALEPSLI